MKNAWFLLFFCSLLAQAQTVTKAPVAIEEPLFVHPDRLSVSQFLSNYFYNGPESQRLRAQADSVCWQSFMFVKFRLDGKARIASFESTPGIPPALVAILKEMVYASEPFWRPRRINNKTVESRDFLLPVDLKCGENCDQVVIKDEYSDALGSSFEKRMEREQELNFLFMLRFDPKDKRVTPTLESYFKEGKSLDCILLQPLLIMPHKR